MGMAGFEAPHSSPTAIRRIPLQSALTYVKQRKLFSLVYLIMSDILAMDGAVNRLVSGHYWFTVPFCHEQILTQIIVRALRTYDPADKTSRSKRIIQLDCTSKNRMVTVSSSEFLRCLYRAL